tara:strand:+ start:6518 stop:7009 length:492 start_codon:yes stop_codon:yes gene_type:complete
MFYTTLAKYTVEHSIQTTFKSKEKLFNFISSTKFFKSYLEEVGNENTKFTPSIEGKLFLNIPQEIEYISNPNITLLPRLFKKIKIKQRWTKKTNELLGNINTYYINFDLKLFSDFVDDKLILNFTATINNKLFFIPNIALKYALQDFGNIFHKIIKINNENYY